MHKDPRKPLLVLTFLLLSASVALAILIPAQIQKAEPAFRVYETTDSDYTDSLAKSDVAQPDYIEVDSNTSAESRIGELEYRILELEGKLREIQNIIEE